MGLAIGAKRCSPRDVETAEALVGLRKGLFRCHCSIHPLYPICPPLRPAASALNALTTAVTPSRSFCQADEQPLFSVNAGIAVEQAMEQASHLLGCIEPLMGRRAGAERVALQYLTVMLKPRTGGVLCM